MQTKLTASSVLPLPFHFATLPYGHSGRVRSALPAVMCEATIYSGALPLAAHCSSASILLNVSVPSPPWQWFIPGTI